MKQLFIQEVKEFVQEYQQDSTTFTQIVTALPRNPTFFNKEELSSNEEVEQKMNFILAISSTAEMRRYFDSHYCLYEDTLED